MEEQNKNVELVEETKELNRTEKHLTKNRLIYSIDTALDIDSYDKLPWSSEEKWDFAEIKKWKDSRKI